MDIICIELVRIIISLRLPKMVISVCQGLPIIANNGRNCRTNHCPAVSTSEFAKNGNIGMSNMVPIIDRIVLKMSMIAEIDELNIANFG